MNGPPPRRRVRGLIAAGLAIDVAVVLLDLLTPDTDIPIGPLVIAPLLPATVGLFEATVGLAVLTAVLAVAMTAAHGAIGEADEIVRLTSVAIILVLVVVGTRLRRRLDQLAQALDALPDAVTIQGAGGVVLYGNRAAARLAGEGETGLHAGSADEYLERMVVTDESGGPLDPESMPAQRLIGGRGAEPVTLRSVDPATGASTWTRVQASPLQDAEGRVRAAVNVIEDITAVKRAEERSAFLADASALLGSSLDTDLTLQRTAELAVPQLADWCCVDLVVPGGRTQVVAVAHTDPARVALIRRLRERYPPDMTREDGIGQLLRTGRPQLRAEMAPEVLARDEEHRALLHELGLGSLLMAPLTIGPRVIGALTWVRRPSGAPYTQEDLDAATALAARAAVAVENARVHGARAEIASVLQAALLPAVLPRAEGWHFAADYRAAGEVNDVGGDFYDVVVLDDGALLALVGDVAGKGARAAALTARTRHTLVTSAELRGGDVRAGLDLLNAALQTEDGLELCSVAVLVARGAELTVVSAGHPLPLLVRGGALCEVGRTSPMLGAAPGGYDWLMTTETLEHGDLLVLHTDGVTDAVGERERFGDARLRSALLDGALDEESAVSRVRGRLAAFEVGAQADDRALLALKYLGR